MFFVTYQANRNFSRPIANTPDDDFITIHCPGEAEGNVAREFLMKRSALERSQILYQYFQSKAYRFGSGIRLHFYKVPAVSFGLVKSYLEMGPDRYTLSHMRDEISLYYSSAGKRIGILIQTHRFARELEIGGLKNMAWEAIKDEESALTVDNVIYLTSFIFAKDGGYGRELKNWLLGHVTKHVQFLNGNPTVSIDPCMKTWEEMVRTLSSGFRKEWKNLAKNEKTSLSSVGEEDAQEMEYTRVFQSLDDKDLVRAERAMTTVKEKKHVSPCKSPDSPKKTPTSPKKTPLSPRKPIITEIISMGEDEYDQGQWEDLDSACHAEIARLKDDSKARSVLGAPATPRFSTSSASSSRPSSLDLETAKARSVMGLNSKSDGAIAGRRKQPTLTRARKSFTNLMR